MSKASEVGNLKASAVGFGTCGDPVLYPPDVASVLAKNSQHSDSFAKSLLAQVPASASFSLLSYSVFCPRG